MDIDLARKVDYWIGVPICFLLSTFLKVQNVFKKKNPKKISPLKIIFLELSEMGSVILAYPAIIKTRELFPKAELFFWIFKRNSGSVDILNAIPEKNVIEIRDKNLFLLLSDSIKTLWRIRREKIDIVIDMELFSRFTSILSYLSGAHIRAGFYRYTLEGLYRGELLTHRVFYNPYNHISDNFLSLIFSLEASDSHWPIPKRKVEDHKINLPQFTAGEEEKENIWNKLTAINKRIGRTNRLILISPDSSKLLPLRKWPTKNYIELIKKILTIENSYVLLIGNEDDKACAENIVSRVDKNRCINLAGMTTFKELITLFSIADLFISHDGGPSNFAALTSIKIIVLFGPETPQLYAPLSKNKTICYANYTCSPCGSAYNHRKTFCRDNKCLQAISVEEVYNVVKERLNE